ncbi:histidine kinase-like ATPase [Podospora appendiculata]|uniref:Histidine kinase-like ATPase n=1 Tax=Podospora appendiculata TaxID=314037 RepID=A0AAE1C6Z6_9PEZI|nr:histidine kinase-like ATPase [Podospora appendiculata]
MAGMDAMDLDSPRGAKRKADVLDDGNAAPRRIKALDPDVVNKIAAGEIIVAPVHALKELIENAVDAGSTSLEILVKDGGLKLLQITDNGSGIDLQKFEDLQEIATYGFRGEALASISHIAHLSVTTRTNNSDCAWRAFYDSGRLAPAKPGQPSDPKPTAGRQGTQITVEDLFYNVPSRRRAFRSASDEYNKIIDMVGRYAIHCHHVAFSCKKHGESSTSISVPANASDVDRIRQIYGASVASELIPFSTSDDRWGFKAKGLATNANYNIKKTTLLLFINHRCNGHPFVYLSLEIDPQRVDVNVHPTKRETLLPGGAWSTPDLQATASTPSKGEGKQSCAYRHQPAKNNQHAGARHSRSREYSSIGSTAAPSANMEMVEYETVDRNPARCSLKTVRELRAAVREDMHHELTEIFANHAFVGIVDERRRLAAMQRGVKLYLVDYGRVCFEYLYQLGLTDFGNFGVIKFSPPLDLRELLSIAAEQEKEETTGKEQRDMDFVAEQLIERREMLMEYFMLEVSPTGELLSIPLLVKGYTPAMVKLPRFLLRLGPYVDWTDEKACFETFLKELASFYVPEQLPATSSAEDGGTEGGEETTLSAEIKSRPRLVATGSLMQAGGVLEVANLKGLYRVFERC